MWKPLVLLLLVCACSNRKVSSENTAIDAFTLRSQTASIRSIDRELANVEIGWIAELVHGDRRAAIVWPALREGRILDNDVVAVVFEKEGANWKRVGREIGPKPSAEALAQALGGNFSWSKPEGLAADELGDHLLATARRFQEHLKGGRSAEAIKAFEDFARAFGPNMLVHDNQAVNILIEGALAKVESIELRDLQPAGDTANANLVTLQDGKEFAVQVNLVRAGSGWAIDRLVL